MQTFCKLISLLLYSFDKTDFSVFDIISLAKRSLNPDKKPMIANKYLSLPPFIFKGINPDMTSAEIKREKITPIIGLKKPVKNRTRWSFTS